MTTQTDQENSVFHDTVIVTPVIQPVRTPNESLLHVLAAFNPGNTTLSALFGVPNPCINGWRKGEAIPPELHPILAELGTAADEMLAAKLRFDSFMIKRKCFNGKTLLEAITNGMPATAAISHLAHIQQREEAQREKMNAHFANRPPSPPTADFDLPY